MANIALSTSVSLCEDTTRSFELYNLLQQAGYTPTNPLTIQLYVQDDGPGLEHSMLPQVTLQKGFSTHSSLGMGFSLMLETMDKVGLCTGSSGTAVLLSKQCVVDDELELDRFLDRFSVTLD